MNEVVEKSVVPPVLKLNFISHGTLISKDLEKTWKFYEEFLGFEVVRTSEVSLWTRLGGDHVYVVVQHTGEREPMPLLNHNGVDVSTDEEVQQCHDLVMDQAEKWGLHRIGKPRVQHGTYSFYFWDMDDNCWEIQSNPKGGYGWMFERGNLQGKGHLDPDFERPALDT